MPLYMDIHTVDSDEFSAEDVVKAHMEDLAIQNQFGVKQLKYWVNEQAKTIFCLMEGPDKEACNQVHVQSHGNTACNIIEVADNEYNLFMGEGTDVDDLAQTDSGELDSGYRTILLINIICFSQSNNSYLKKTQQIIKEYNGVIVREPWSQIMVSFVAAAEAIACTLSIKEMLDLEKSNFEYNMAVVSGKPVDEEGETFFEETKFRVNNLCSLGLNNRIYLDKASLLLAEKNALSQKENQRKFTIIDKDNFEFSKELSGVVNKNFIKSDFNSETLFKLLGLSKSKASRMIKALTDMSPNQLIQEYRLQKALSKMIEKKTTIAEIAYASGFNSPTYFARVFKKRFGISPTEFTSLV